MIKVLELSPICACDCGLPVTRSKLPPYNWNNFISGHNSIGNQHRKGKIGWTRNLLEENQPNYKDGRTKKIKQWELSVKERDDYTCQICNKKVEGSNCDAHHIKSRKEFPELIYDVDNGQTLCHCCHTSIHQKGCHRSEQIKQKMRKSMSEEQRRNISIALTGRKQSEEQRRNISKGLKKAYVEGRRKIGVTQ